MTDRLDSVKTWFFSGHGGARLAVHELGSGPVVVLLHGLFSNAQTNWIKFGTAERIAQAGFRVVMPDLRAHGESDAPHDPAAYPKDVLALDAEALIAELGVDTFDFGGFSLGARTTALLLQRGLRPRRAILAGMGLEGLSNWDGRRAFFQDVIAHREEIVRGDHRWIAAQFMKSMGIDPDAARLLLDSFGDFDPAPLRAVDTETLVVCGDEDADNGDPQALADLLPDATLRRTPGTHMSSVTKAELGEAIAGFLTA